MNAYKPKVGLCVIDHPLEVGSDQSKKILQKAVTALREYDLVWVHYEKIVNSDQEVSQAGPYFYQAGIDVLLIIQTTWSNDHHATDLLNDVPVPVCLWALPGMETGSLCGIHQLGVVLSEIGKKYKIFFGAVDDRKTHDNIVSYCKAAGLRQYLKKQKIGLIGYRVPGMTEVTFDELELKKKFGPRLVHFGIGHLQQMAQDVAVSQAEQTWKQVKQSGIRISVREEDGIWSCRNYLALKRLAQENDIKGFAVECYPELMGQVCLAASLLPNQGIVLACEGDVNAALAMMMLFFLTGKPVHNTDLLNPDSDNSITYSHCGSGHLGIAEDQHEVKLCPVRLQDCGVCVTFLPKLGKITLLNIVGRKDTYRLSAITGYSQRTHMVFPGNPVSARFDITADKVLEVIAQNAVGHHWMIGYGHIAKEIQYFSELAEVRLINFQ